MTDYDGPERRHIAHVDTDDMHSLAIRMTMVEAELKSFAAIKKWIMTGVFIVLIQAGGFIYGYAQMSLKVDTLGGNEVAVRIIQLNGIVADHSKELEQGRLEQARMRGRYDSIDDQVNEIDDRLENIEYIVKEVE